MSGKAWEPSKNDPVTRLWASGADITGSIAGAGLGMLAAGPGGAILGAGAGPSIAAAIKEYAHRTLGKRQSVRIGAAFQYAVAAYEERISVGDEVRDDGFFDRTHHSSDADEVLDGILVQVQQEHEERKVRFLGYLMANIAFEASVDAHLAHWLAKVAGELTWSQYVVLAAVGTGKAKEIFAGIRMDDSASTWTAFGVRSQVADLGYGKRELVAAPARKTKNHGLSVPNLSLEDLTLKGAGKLLFALMWLERIPREDMCFIEDALR
ncbi:hypothetical protein ACFQV2_19485 [Actinokineospora soli]|uniref:Uncharacterized protein n=1 Tax=Actinokineospora soli TaxID=1048753 RepID=A0ABW2TQR6_9PSEU